MIVLSALPKSYGRMRGTNRLGRVIAAQARSSVRKRQSNMQRLDLPNFIGERRNKDADTKTLSPRAHDAGGPVSSLRTVVVLTGY